MSERRVGSRWRIAWALSVLSLAIGPSCRQVEEPVPEGALVLKGAGATFPAPLYQKWINEYQRLRPDVLIDYEAVGSGEGERLFLNQVVDFGASDAALTDDKIAKVTRQVHLIPSVAGSVCLAYHLEGLDGELRLPRDVYTDIFLGRIRQWNDPRIARANPDLALPDLVIAVIVRQDSSGTTFAFTNHLAAISREWAEGPGAGKEIDWPGKAMRARGNEGVAAQIQRTPGAIGYVEYGIASRTGLSLALLENKAGQFVRPTADSGLATLTSTPLPDNFRAFFPDPDGPRAYPIVTYSWLLLYGQYPDPDRREELKQFVTWCLTDGQQYNAELGYIQLAPAAAERLVEVVRRIE